MEGVLKYLGTDIHTEYGGRELMQNRVYQTLRAFSCSFSIIAGLGADKSVTGLPYLLIATFQGNMNRLGRPNALLLCGVAFMSPLFLYPPSFMIGVQNSL